ncbi:MAG: DNA polymerase III subunit alpha [Mogibacterium sp.]|nr:DNA polymerase III subunit alpha [Mogibacterium sp.]
MFTHLHLHTEYSLLDGMNRISELPNYVKELGMEACAITDHGAMFGVVDFYKSCKKAGIKPIIGCEVYTAARSLYDKDSDRDRNSGHLILLAETQKGYSNLVKIISKSYVDGFYYKPRVDKTLLREFSEGIICLSGCLVGNIQRMLLNGDYEGAKAEALELLDIFGRDNFFLEIQNHHLDEDPKVISGLKRLSADIAVPLVATNDAHYMKREDAVAQDVLMCIQTQTEVSDEDRMRFENDEFYVKSETEMLELFPDIPDAVRRTQEIADRCNVEFTFGDYHLPEYKPPQGKTCEEYLRELCMAGLEKKYGKDATLPSSEYLERLETELKVIEDMGYVEYFLIVWDFIHYAKINGIAVGPGRGSAAGSIVAYSLDITEIDPIKYSLIFERFLNPERISMPDIDIDFCIERRQEVIDYVVRKYGKDKVSQIITFGTLKPKAAVRDIARALGASYAEGDEISKAIPNELGITIAKALKVNPDLKNKYMSNPLVKQVLDLSMALEGLPRHASTHAAGIVISSMALDEYVPLYSSDKGVATQFNMTTIEELGLLKMDFLGLRNLTVIRDALRMIKENHGVEIDFSSIGYDDPDVYKLISEGNTKGIFQLESRGMTDFMRNLRPSCFEDIVAGIALYRPGPMDSIPKYIENKKHPERIRYVDPHLEPILGVTYGCLIYQEQVMQIVRDLGGYSFGRSDLVRRAMSKKKMDVMLKEKELFINGKRGRSGEAEIAGCVANGVPAEAAEAIFDDMVSFASYAFNKSHAAAYAVISYQTAYLKCHYPVEFMAALMTSMAGDFKHTSDYVRNCKEMGIAVDPPSVMKSEKNYSVQDGRIRFGLLGVKNVGEGIAEAIIEGRKNPAARRDIYSFVESIDGGELNKKAIEALVRSGAFDELNSNRAVLMAVCGDAVHRAQKKSRMGNKDQMSLFDLEGFDGESIERPAMPRVIDFDDDTKLTMEKEMIGVYLSGHPLGEYSETIKKYTNVSSADLTAGSEEFRTENEDDSLTINTSKFKDGDRVVMAGMITGVRTMFTKKSQEMARMSVEDFDGVIDIIVFPGLFGRKRDIIGSDNIVAVSGKVSFRDENGAEILADDIVPIENISELARKLKAERAVPIYDDLSLYTAEDEPMGDREYFYGGAFPRGNPQGTEIRQYGAEAAQFAEGRQQSAEAAQFAEGRQQSAEVAQFAEGRQQHIETVPKSAQIKPQAAETPLIDPIKLRVSEEVLAAHGDSKGVLLHLTDMLGLYPGERDVLVYLPNGRMVRINRDRRITLSEELKGKLIRLLGEENIKY